MWETSVNSCGPSVGDKGETNVNSCGPRNPDWETRGRQVYKAPRVGNKGDTQSGKQRGDKRKLTRPKAPRVGDKWRQGGDKCELMRPKAPRVGDKGETSVNSCGPRHPEWETRCKLMRPKAPKGGCKPGDKGKIGEKTKNKLETRGENKLKGKTISMEKQAGRKSKLEGKTTACCYY